MKIKSYGMGARSLGAFLFKATYLRLAEDIV